MRSIALITNIKYLLILVYYAVLMLLLFNFQTLSFRIYEQLNSNSIILDPYLDFSKGLILSVVFALIFLRHKAYLFLWLIKAFVTLFLLLPYEFHYGLDSFTYFHWAVNFDLQTIESYWGLNSTRHLIVFVHYLTYILGDSYYAIKIFFSFLGFIGLIIFYEVYKYIADKNNIFIPNNKFIYILFLFPSIIFWSSTLGKDSLNLFLASIFVYFFIQLHERLTITSTLLIVFSLISMFYLRSWWVAIMLLSGIVYTILYPSKRLIFIMILASPFLLYVTQGVFESRGVSSIKEILEEMSYVSRVMAQYGSSSIEVTSINSIADYVVQYIPNLFTAIYRPMVWEISNAFTLIAAIENVILLYFTFKHVLFRLPSIFRIKYLSFLFVFIIIWSLPYSIISSANLGAAARFKLQIIPLILIIISISYYSKNNSLFSRKHPLK